MGSRAVTPPVVPTVPSPAQREQHHYTAAAGKGDGWSLNSISTPDAIQVQSRFQLSPAGAAAAECWGTQRQVNKVLLFQLLEGTELCVPPARHRGDAAAPLHHCCRGPHTYPVLLSWAGKHYRSCQRRGGRGGETERNLNNNNGNRKKRERKTTGKKSPPSQPLHRGYPGDRANNWRGEQCILIKPLQETRGGNQDNCTEREQEIKNAICSEDGGSPSPSMSKTRPPLKGLLLGGHPVPWSSVMGAAMEGTG